MRAADAPTAIEAQSRALQRASASVVGLRALAVDDARSAATLGRARQGSGVVIGRGDLVLTIGYLVLEAEQVQLVTDDEREVPARLVGYDVATGFGLVQALAPLRIEPVPLGLAAALHHRRGADDRQRRRGRHGQRCAAGVAPLLRRLLGIPRRRRAVHRAGAAPTTAAPRLFNGRGELVGIGSLLVKDALGPGAPQHNGNMFVPIDLLEPILPELRSRGSSHLSRRAWMGVNCVEAEGTVRVVRVNSDSPAEVAGLEPGDRIVRIDGTEVKALEVLWKTLWAGGAPEREVTLDIVRDGQPQTLKLQSVDRMKTLKRAQGI